MKRKKKSRRANGASISTATERTIIRIVKDHFSARDQLVEKDRRIAELEAKLKAYEAQDEVNS